MPQRLQYTNGSRPMADLRMEWTDGDISHLSIPVPVARRMSQKKRNHELDNPIEQSRLSGALQVVMEETATQIVYELLARRDYSVSEIRNRLVSKGFATDVADRTIERFEEAGLLSNQRFADAFIRRKIAAGQGSKRIAYELGQRGIDVGDLKGWPSDFINQDEERERALALALRKNVREPNAYAKMVRFLSGRGYSLAMSKSVAREVLFSQ